MFWLRKVFVGKSELPYGFVKCLAASYTSAVPTRSSSDIFLQVTTQNVSRHSQRSAGGQKFPQFRTLVCVTELPRWC